ncbi:MAG: S8 family serine peptidase [Deltaproteobacteria bacterium]|nr:S8 family serine peptidase [Deltaproteobacteria bacterium]
MMASRSAFILLNSVGRRLLTLGLIALPLLLSASKATESETGKKKPILNIVPGKIIVRIPLTSTASSQAVRGAKVQSSNQLGTKSSSSPSTLIPENIPDILMKVMGKAPNPDTVRDIKTRSMFSVKNHSGVSGDQKNRTSRFSTAAQSQAASSLQYQYLSVDARALIPVDNRTTEETLEWIRRLNRWGIEAYPDYVVTLFENDPHFPPVSGAWQQSFPDLWGLEKTRTVQAWETTRAAGQIVAVIDTGVDDSHPDLQGQVIRGRDFINGDDIPNDDHGHGTHVAGTIAAIANNGIGIAGVAPESRILAIKVLSGNGSGDLSGLAEGIRYAADNGATVINMSLGAFFEEDSPPYLTDSIRYAHDKNVVIVAAAGNSSANVRNFVPANDPRVIAVSAFNYSDAKAWFSNFGNRISVAAPGGGDISPEDVYCPGCSILSLFATGTTTFSSSLKVDTNLARLQGTSMAAPHVAGVAALIRAAHEDFSNEQVRQALLRGSNDVAQTGFDIESGFGRINAEQAVAIINPLEALITLPSKKVSGTGDVAIPGTVTVPNLGSWELLFQRDNGKDSWQSIGTGTSSIKNDTLTNWNIRTVPTGTYVLRLNARTQYGEQYEFRTDLVIDQFLITSPTPKEITPFRGGIIEVRGTVFANDLKNYKLRVEKLDGKSVDNAKITLASGGYQTVTDGLLGSWDTEGIEADVYRIVLIVETAAETQERHTDVLVDPSLHPGWPRRLSLICQNIMCSIPLDHLTVADIDGDGTSEIFVGYDNKVHIFDHSGQEHPGWPQAITPGATIYGGPAVGDVDRDGAPDIIAPAGLTYAWKADGTAIRWNTPWLGASDALRLAITDLDGDGFNEVIQAQWHGLLVRDQHGNILPGWPVQYDERKIVQAPAIADVDGDGRKEIAFAAVDGGLLLVNLLRMDGSPMDGWPRKISGPYGFSYPILVDLDGNGDLEIALSNGTTVYVFEHTGADFHGWPVSTINNANSVTAGDVDGDGDPEIIVGTTRSNYDNNRYLYVFHANGTPLPLWPIESTSSHSYFGYGAAALGDLDGDGRADIVVSSDSSSKDRRALHAFRFDKSEVQGFPKPILDWYGIFSGNTAALNDIDGDGKLNLVWMDHGLNIYVWDLPAPANVKLDWPMFHHDAQHTGASANAKDRTPPELNYIRIRDIYEDRATIQWDTDEPSDSVVEYGTTASYGSATILNPEMVKAHSVPITGLSAETVYHFRVISKDRHGNEAKSIPDRNFRTIDGTAPQISNIEVSNILSSSASISWNTDELSDTEIWYGLTESSLTYHLSNVTLVFPQHWINLSNLISDTQYFYRVISRDSSGNIAQSEVLTFRTLDVTPPRISNVRPTVITGHSAQIVWNTDEDTNSMIEYGTTTAYGSSTGLDPQFVKAHAMELSGLTSETTYHYRIVARDTAGNEAKSADFILVTLDVTAPQISNVQPFISGNSATISWNTNELSNSEITYGMNPDAITLRYSDPSLVFPKHEITVSNLRPGSDYFFQLSSKDLSGNVARTNSIMFSTKLAAPLLIAKASSSSSILLAWVDLNTTEHYFAIQRAPDNPAGPWQEIITLPSSTEFFKDSGLNPYTRYYYRIIVYKSSDDTSSSQIVSDKTFPEDNIIFVSSKAYPANMGGATTYDKVCNLLAASGKKRPDRPWKAILSTEAINAKDRITQMGSIYNPGKNVPQRKVAQVSSLFQRPLLLNIIYDEYGISRSDNVGTWTGTRADGTTYKGRTCNNWSANAGLGIAGSSQKKDKQWLNNASVSCAKQQRIYCISQ